MRIPSYDCLVVIASRESSGKIIKSSKSLGYSCSVVGSLEEGNGVFIDGIMVEGVKLTKLDEIYGSFR